MQASLIDKTFRAPFLALRSCIAVLLVSTLLGGCIGSAASGAENAPKPEADDAAIGNLKGVRVSIPQKYRFFGVLYEGEDTWRPETRRKMPATFDTPISSFSVLVRLPNMEPLSPANEQSWRDFQMNNGKDDSWVTIHADTKVVNMSLQEWGRGSVDIKRTFLIHKSLGWTVKRLDEKRYGLATEVQVGPDKRDNDIRIEDLMYDEKTWNTIIECGAGGLGPGGHHVCKQFFVIPEMNLSVNVQYQAIHLPEWAAIQKKITTVIKSFRVSE